MQGGKKEQKQWTQVQAKRMEPKVCHKRALEQSCSKKPPRITRNIQKKRKGWNLKGWKA